jgi:hypothetical protein
MHTYARPRGCPESLFARPTAKPLIESSAVYGETKYQAIEECSSPFWERLMVNDCMQWHVTSDFSKPCQTYASTDIPKDGDHVIGLDSPNAATTA